jgi:hypothetical protein
LYLRSFTQHLRDLCVPSRRSHNRELPGHAARAGFSIK